MIRRRGYLQPIDCLRSQLSLRSACVPFANAVVLANTAAIVAAMCVAGCSGEVSVGGSDGLVPSSIGQPGAVVPGAVVPGAVVPGAVVPGAVVPGAVVPGAPSPEAVAPGAVPAPATVPPLTGIPETQPAVPTPVTGDPLAPEATAGACVAAPMSRGVRALNGVQYRNTIAKVFGVENLADPFVLSDKTSQFSTFSALFRLDLNTSQTVRDNSRRIAEAVAPRVLQSEPCLQDGGAACVENWVRTLGRRLYRGPVDDAHAGELLRLFTSVAGQATSLQAITLVVRAMVSSPRFLFRKELGQLDDATGQYELTPHEVASAIAYTLTDAPPDEVLSADADAGMAPKELIRTHVPRLVASGASGRNGLRAFVEEFFAVRNFFGAEKDPDLFPEFDETLQAQLMEDFQNTVDGMLGSVEPSFSELILGKNYSVGEGTATLLGWPAGEGVTLVPEVERQGLMTHPVVLGTYAHEAETNPVARGHFVSSNLLCVKVPDPPDDVVFPERVDDGTPRTLRQVIDEQHSVQSCAGCHTLMDPMGYPFEVFDAVGRLRDNDQGLPLDATGSINATGEIDGPVSDLSEMLAKVAQSEVAHSCFAAQAFRYVSGLGEVTDIGCRTEALSEQFLENNGSLPELFSAILDSPQFLHRVDAPLAE